MEWLELERWSPYAVGIGLGILSWLSFLLSDQALACSTAFARSAGMLERLVRGPKVLDKPYYRKFVPKVEWGWMLVGGMVIGAFISAQLSGTFDWRWNPGLWERAFGAAVEPRLLTAFGGGILVGWAPAGPAVAPAVTASAAPCNWRSAAGSRRPVFRRRDRQVLIYRVLA